MNILFISSYYLFRETRFGGSKRLYLFAKELEKYGKMSLLCLDGCKEMVSAGPTPETHPEFDHFLYLPLSDTRNFITKTTRSGIIIEDLVKKYSEKIRSFLGGRKYDVVFLAFTYSLSFIGTVIRPGSIPMVYCEDDLFLEKVRDEKLDSPVGFVYRYIRKKQLVSFYRKKLAAVNMFIAISNEEKNIIKRYFPALPVALIGYGINPDEYLFIKNVASPFTLGFIGNYDHIPNMDAMIWFLRDIYPQVKNAIPDLRLIVAGKNIPERLRHDYGADSSISWLENVCDLRTFYSGISVFVNPILSGRGLRTKLIEAAAFGKPIISTRLGAEGIEDLQIDIAETAGDFITCCRRLMSEDGPYLTIAMNNRNMVIRRYSISTVGSRLIAVLSSVAGVQA
jgi:glycosyltransferase involved in cell wall biosynthesis